MIRAVTFDFWDTLAVDDSDEPERAARGLLPKPQARERLFVEAVLAEWPDQEEASVLSAYNESNRRAAARWKQEHVTSTVAERLGEALALAGLDQLSRFNALIHAFEHMEVEVPPRLLPGAAEALRELAGRYRLGIISDTIITPGRGLRQILAQNGVLDCFSAFVFSDEVGRSKPARPVFDAAATQLGLPASEIVHVGDRENNDVLGPQAAGFRAVLFTGAVDRGSENSRADAICDDLRQLSRILQELS